jgi:hypothetical protein
MNIQHSSRSDEWYTPLNVIRRVHDVLGDVELDPASTPQANTYVRAQRILTREQDGLTADWGAPRTIFLNPPSGKRGRESLPGLFWQRLISQRYAVGFDHAIFLAFSIEQLQTTQMYASPIAIFPFCVPKQRLQFRQPDGTTGQAPTHSNMIVYVPGNKIISLVFANAFRDMGAIING